MFNTNMLHNYIWVVILYFFMLFYPNILLLLLFFIECIIPVKVKKTIACSINGDLQCYLQGTFSAKNSTPILQPDCIDCANCILLLALNFGDLLNTS